MKHHNLFDLPRLWLLLAVAALGAPLASHAGTIAANPGNYRNLLDTLQPGDTLALASGTYTDGLPITGMNGTAAAPIVIAGPSDQSAVFEANSCCNTVQLDTSSYIEVRNLTLDGQHLDGPFGVDSRGPCHHITIEGLRIINHGPDQATIGISTKGSAWNWIIRRNVILAAGTGMYLGNSDGAFPFVGGIIEYNFIQDTTGYNIEIKQQNPRPTNVGLPTSDSRTIIRHNVLVKSNNASGGDLARPNLLVGHFPLSGAGMNDLYEIYGNFLYDNPSEALFQGEGNIALHDNVLVNHRGAAINVQPHNDLPRNVTIYHNTVVASDSGINVTGGAAGTVQRIIANAVFADPAIRGPNQSENIVAAYASAGSFLSNPTGPIGSLDVFPLPGALSGATVDLAQFSTFTDGTRDFNGKTRAGVFRGAYEGEGANPGWKLALAIKGEVGGSPPKPTITLTADAATVPAQGSTTLRWSAANATSCTASGGWSGSRPLSGSALTGALSQTTTYTLSCTGAGGTSSSAVVVSVSTNPPPPPTPAPTINLTAAPTTVTSGSSAMLSWSTTNATSCTASGAWSGTRATSGSQSTGQLSANATFRLDCTGAGGQANRSVAVSVTSPTTPPPPPSPPPPSPPPPTTPPGGGGSSGGGGSIVPAELLLLAGAALRLARRRFSLRPTRS